MNHEGDAYRMDSHKLMYHPREVARWLETGDVHPLYMEVSPSGACNHRCSFCALDYLEYRPRFLDTAVLTGRLAELARLGTRSIMYAGEGEPLLHPEMAAIVRRTRDVGIDVAITTNGTLLSAELFAEMAESLSWLKVSLNAGTTETYAALHGTCSEDFDRVLGNIASAAEIRREKGAPCTLGVQMVLLPENAAEAATLAARVREAGADYLVVKPYSQHRKSRNRTYEHFDYLPHLALKEELASLATDDFQVIFRDNAMHKVHREVRGYRSCLALPFWSYIDAGGNVWGCSSYLGDPGFCYGNIGEQTFEGIWQGERRKKSLQFVAERLDVSECRTGCRMDEVNRYLWELKNPAAHVNFI